MARFNGKRLRAVRQDRKLTQAELAKRVRVARNTINRLEIGDRDPSTELRDRLAKALGVSVAELAGGAMESYGYQVEKLNNAVSTMMSPTMSAEKRVAYAMSEADIAFHHAAAPREFAGPYETMRRLLTGDGSYVERAARLSELQLHAFRDALFSLHQRVLRAYHVAEAR